MPIDPKLSDILVCPVSKGKLIYRLDKEPVEGREPEELLCKMSKLAYPVRENIPVMLESEARKLTLEEIEALK